MNRSISAAAGEAFVGEMVARMRALAERMVEMARTGEPTLGELEAVALESAKSLGNALLEGLCGRRVGRSPAPEVGCDCGGVAHSREMRTVHTKTVLDTIQVRRAYYHCQACHHGVAPLDRELGRCPGGVSAGLEAGLALLGVTQDAFEHAATVRAKLSLVCVCPNSVRAATETLGALVVAEEEAPVAAAWAPTPT